MTPLPYCRVADIGAGASLDHALGAAQAIDLVAGRTLLWDTKPWDIEALEGAVSPDGRVTLFVNFHAARVDSIELYANQRVSQTITGGTADGYVYRCPDTVDASVLGSPAIVRGVRGYGVESAAVDDTTVNDTSWQVGDVVITDGALSVIAAARQAVTGETRVIPPPALKIAATGLGRRLFALSRDDEGEYDSLLLQGWRELIVGMAS